VEGLGIFRKPTGQLGTVERANEDDAVFKWDDDGPYETHKPSLKKIQSPTSRERRTFYEFQQFSVGAKGLFSSGGRTVTRDPRTECARCAFFDVQRGPTLRGPSLASPQCRVPEPSSYRRSHPR